MAKTSSMFRILLFLAIGGAAPAAFAQAPVAQVVNPCPRPATGGNDPPAIVAHQGTVETWTIQDRTMENHEFHLHQVHFLVKSQNHFEINGSQPATGIQGDITDTVDVPFWDGNPEHP